MTIRNRTLGALLALFAAVAGVTALALFSPTVASDHLIQAEPEQDATVAEAPHQLILTFDRPLVQVKGVHDVEVTDGAGYRVDDGQPSISTYSQRTLIVPIHTEGDGSLEVHYRVRLMGDGEDIDVISSYNFSVDHTLAPTDGDQVEAAAEVKSSQSLVLWTIAILIGIAVAGGLIYFLRMATGNSRSSLEPTNRSVFRD